MAEYKEVPQRQPSSNPVHVGDGIAATRHGQSPAMRPITVSHAQLLVESEERFTPTCICGSKYTRLDALKRHIKRHTEDPAHPCLLCTRYQGPNAFHRADHLAQHIRHKHRSYGPAETEQAPAQVPRIPDLPDLPPLPFSCVEPGCTRSGQYGFLRQVDLDEHMMVHALLQGSMPYQLGSVDPNAPPMNNVFDQGQDYHFGQGITFQPTGNFFEDSSYGMNMAGEQDNNFQQYINYGPADYHAGYRVNMAGGQENNFQQHSTYEPAGGFPQYGGFQMNGVDEYGNEINEEQGFLV